MIDSIISKVMKLISKYIQKELNPCVEKTIIQFIRFGIVGISNTIISYVKDGKVHHFLDDYDKKQENKDV